MNGLLAALSLFSLMAGAPAPAEPTIRAVTLGGDPWPPYVTGELGGEATGGTGVALMNELFGRLGVELRLPLQPWLRALRDVERGTIDGIGILMKTPQREQYIAYTEELFRSHNKVWYSRRVFPDGFAWDRLEDLSAYRLGAVAGHSYGPDADALIAAGALDPITVSSVDQMFAMLGRGRIDLAITSAAVGESWRQRHPQLGAQIVAASRTVWEEVFYIGFSRRSAARALIPRLNQAIAELRAEGRIDALLAPRTEP